MMMARRVLVIEDDRDTRALLEMTLSCDGYSVSTASNGYEGLIVARRNPPDAILLDYVMPAMNGYEFRVAQLEDAKLASIPVICVSGRHDIEEMARRMRVTVWFSKPFDVELITRELAKLFAPTPSQGPASLH